MRFATLALLLGLVATPGVALAQDAGIPGPTKAQPAAATPAAPSASSSAPLHGVDVSTYQGTIDWARVAQSGIKFAFVRAGDGFHHDTHFAKNWSGTKSAGILRGAYHYFRGSKDGTQQANDFLNVVGDDTGDFAPVADVEELDGVSASTLAAQLEKWVATVKTRTGRTPIIYTSPGLWNGWHMGSSFSSEQLWVANWATSKPRMPTGWSDWTFWQYRSDASVPGITGRVDADLFHGSLDELKAFGKSGAAPTSHPTIPLRVIPITPGLAGVINATTGAPGTATASHPGQTGSTEAVDDGDTTQADPLLRLTAAGTNVKRLQNLLNANGADLNVDGDFGPETEAAVREFQQTHGCQVDGVVGPETWGALEIPRAAPTATPIPATTTTTTRVVTPVVTRLPSSSPLATPMKVVPLKTFPAEFGLE